MKASNNFERECEKIQFESVSFDYLFDDKFEYKGFYNNGEVVCGKCGNINKINTKAFYNTDALYENKDPFRFYRCKFCNAGNHIEIDKRLRKYFDRYWIEKLEIHNDIQISRIFVIELNYEKRKLMKVNPIEVIRVFFRKKKDNKYFVALSSILFQYCNWTWTYCSSTSFEFRRKGSRIYNNCTSISCDAVYPDIQLLEDFKYLRYEKVINEKYNNNYIIDFYSLVKAYEKNNKIYEILVQDDRFDNIKSSNHTLFQLYVENKNIQEKIIKYFNSLRIAVNHKYKINDLRMYFDYLEDLVYLKLDLNNPYYICPDNLIKAHQKTNKKVRYLKRMFIAKGFEQEYLKYVKKYLNIDIGDSNIIIKILPNVKAFLEEGNALDHCVFTNGYYEKICYGILILSAKDRITKERLETIELDVASGTILQSRGKDNNPSPKHQQIINLVENNYKLLNGGIV